MWHQLDYVDSSRKWFLTNEFVTSFVIEYSYYRIHALAFFFPSYDRKDNASIGTFVLIVALEATNSKKCV